MDDFIKPDGWLPTLPLRLLPGRRLQQLPLWTLSSADLQCRALVGSGAWKHRAPNRPFLAELAKMFHPTLNAFSGDSSLGWGEILKCWRQQGWAEASHLPRLREPWSQNPCFTSVIHQNRPRAFLSGHSPKIRRTPRPNRMNSWKEECWRDQMSFSSSKLSTFGKAKFYSYFLKTTWRYWSIKQEQFQDSPADLLNQNL